MKSVSVYSDGACLGNPGPGGYGVILDHGGQRRERSKGYRLTTNNRMELLGVIAGMEALSEPCNVRVVTDSNYVVQGIEQGRAARWRSRGWLTANKTPAKNVDLWEKLLALCDRHTVRFEWVRGHSGHPENERCDELANSAATAPRLISDEAYEASIAATSPHG